MLIIAGLGNPGNRYAANRHNIGFMAADEIVRRHSFAPWKSKHQADISSGTIDGEKVLVVKPQTMMNNSGQSIGEILRFYKEELDNLIVIYDELDLDPGKVRIKKGGGSGGHNGIKSIDAHCGKDYRRMRVGIGHPGNKEQVIHHVLGDFSKADHDWLDPLLANIADNASELAKNNDSSFMNKLALSTQENAKPEQKPKKKSMGKPQSHIHQARQNNKPKPPTSGPMADMLKKLFDKKKDN